MFTFTLLALLYVMIKPLNFTVRSSILTVSLCSSVIFSLLLAVFFDQLNILLFGFYLIGGCMIFYLIFSSKKMIVLLLTLKSYYLFLVASLMIFSLCELITRENLYNLMTSKHSLPIVLFAILMVYGTFEVLCIKSLDKEKLDYLFASISNFIPLSMFILLIGKNCSLLYVLLFSRHAYLVTMVILASTLLEIYFGVFAVLGILKAYSLSIYKHKNKILHMQHELQLSNLKQLESYQADIRKIAHDLHNHKTVMHKLLEEKDYEAALDYLKNYDNILSHNKSEVLTSHKILNAILLAKKELCVEHNIRLNLDINIPSQLSISDFDLCILVGNLIDNAIEASQKIAPTGHAYIQVKSAIINQNFIFDIKNNFDGVVNLTPQKILTTKKDKLNHGLGLSNVHSTVNKYQGTCQFTFHEDIFSSLIMIPLEEPHQKNTSSTV